MTTRLLRGMFIIAFLHFCVGTFLYTHPPKHITGEYRLIFAHFVYFILPVILAFAGYVWVYWHSAFLAGRTGWRAIVATLFALVAVAISEFVTMVFSIGLYGE